MSQSDRPVKGVALYTESERELWERAEKEARQQMDSTAREGEVLAEICAGFLGDR